jgi:ADP-L-glycero-D-manno-heptose 6-epimerase
MIILTGGAGFIGSCLLKRLNDAGQRDILVVDHLNAAKRKNLMGKKFSAYMDKAEFLGRVLADRVPGRATALIHLGACSSTLETDARYLEQNNTRYTASVVEWALRKNARVIYASSAATYGAGEEGYADDSAQLERLRPLNGYGLSKHRFDLWALRYGLLRRVVGYKFFNVFGPNEAHKGEMRSLVDKAYLQVRDSGKIGLFKSHKKGIKDGEQTRDFIYVKDVVEVLLYTLRHPELNGLYNLGTGKARSWNDLASAVFKAMGKRPNIQYIPMPAPLRKKYQYHTQADMRRLFKDGQAFQFSSLEDAVADYVQNYLVPGRRL